MIKPIKKGGTASYKGYLLGLKEYNEYQELKQLVPKFIQAVQELKK